MSVDADGRYGGGGSLGRVHVFFPGNQVITRHASVLAPSVTNFRCPNANIASGTLANL